MAELIVLRSDPGRGRRTYTPLCSIIVRFRSGPPRLVESTLSKAPWDEEPTLFGWGSWSVTPRTGQVRNGNGVAHSTGNDRINIGSVISGGCRPSRIASTIFGANGVSRRIRLT